ncbi:AAA family ATPase [Chryseobacterium vrystaatense]|uniref:Predicted ATPase n=1 Tax=Chryseobacterium vrystaatense TaxID=307480 RepID=A0A1M5DUT9_9FLAO|nr:AAA family ATPase [Chryseobacterium vrystaatense]SHF70686.1 Predicted ATPase [Chryseobacterium vrystaatense]
MKTNGNISDQLYIITGGPGVGKTTILNELEKMGFLTVPEEARRIIKEQVRVDGDGLPWRNKELYAELMFSASLQTYQTIKNTLSKDTVFFDRGLLDTVCYMNMENIPVPVQTVKAVHETKYNPNVFMLPPWKEIYETDSERKQDWEEAVFTFEKMKQTYLDYGYTVIEVPKDKVENRVKFIIDRIEES